MKKIIFMGTPSYATNILKALVEDKSFDISMVVTKVDKPSGRGQKISYPHIKEYILENNLDIELYQVKSLKDESVVKKLSDLKPDFIVVAAYGQILPKDILDIAPCINLHASLLPKYRGASPIQSAILNGDSYSGVTAMLMSEGLDEGDILSYSVLNIEGMNSIELFDKLSFMAGDLIVKCLKEFDNIEPIKQLDALSSYAKKIQKSDGLVEFNSAKEIDAKYRAFIFWPGVYLSSGLKLKDLSLDSTKGSYKAGEIIKIESDFIVVGCKEGRLLIRKVQAPSKKEVDAVSYLKGKRLYIGDTLL